jgi:outer membrane immunogenic protein
MKTASAFVIASLVGALGLSSAASAADMAVKAAPMPVAIAPGWQGFYLGINGGGGWSDTTFRGVPITGDHFLLPISSVSTGNSNDSNWVFGGQIGYNWQINRFVLGIEGDWSGANVRNSTGLIPDPVFAGENIRLQSKIEQYGSIVGRVGFAPTNDWLLYARGGWATARITSNPQDFFPLPATLQHFSSGAAWHSGGTVGAGVEYKFARNWVVGLQYDYYDFGTERHSNPVIATTGAAVGAPTFYSQDVSTRMSTITGRISYLFNYGPVVAKY